MNPASSTTPRPTALPPSTIVFSREILFVNSTTSGFRAATCREHSNGESRIAFSATHPYRKRDAMTRRFTLCLIACVLAVVFVCSSVAQAVPPLDKIQNHEELNRAVTALDAALFDSYNKCD